MAVPHFRSTVLVLALGAAFGVSAQVKPPPLPVGSSQVKAEPGLDPVERKRYVRAHHTKAHIKRDPTKDDSDPANNGNGNGNANGAGNGNGNSKSK